MSKKKENYNADRRDYYYDTSNIDDKLLYDKSLTKTDEQGSIYSIDGKKLYRASSSASELRLAEGLEIICDKAISFHWSEMIMKREVFLPKSLKAIGDLAFFENDTIKRIYIHEFVSYISHVNPFAGCNELEEIVTYEKGSKINDHYVIHEGFLFDRINRTLIAELPFKHEKLLDLNDKKKISFYNWDESEIQKIGCYAFYGTEIETVNFSGRITSSFNIPDSCFCNSNVKSVKLPIFCHEIGEKAFYQSKLENIILGSINRIEYKAFCECNLKQVSLGENVYVGDCAFKNSPLCYINFIGTPFHIGEKAFVSDNLDTIRCANKEMLTFDFIQKFQSNQNVQLIFADDIIPVIDDIKFVSSSVSINNPDSYNVDIFYRTMNITPYDAEVVRIRIPSDNRFLWGVRSMWNFIVLPRFDSISAVIAFDNIYSLAETNLDNTTLYHLFIKSKQIYSVETNEKLQLNNCNVIFKHIYKTSDSCYDERNLRTEFMDSREYDSIFFKVNDVLPTKFVSLRKNGKFAVIVSGKFISEFEYDCVKAIDNVFLQMEMVKGQEVVTPPDLSMTCILIGREINGNEKYGILNEQGSIVLPISFSKISVCMNYILADRKLYRYENAKILLICSDVDLSVPVFVYKGSIAIFKSNDSYYVYRNTILSKIEEDKYVFFSSDGYSEYYDIEAGCLYIEDDERFDDYDSGYLQDELNDMYRDAYDGNPEYESNID